MEKKLLQQMAESGKTIREISNSFEKSYTTTRYWLNKFSIQTKGMQSIASSIRPEALAAAVDASNSVGEVLDRLGMGTSSGEYKALRKLAELSKIDLPMYRGGSKVLRPHLSDSDFFAPNSKRCGKDLRRRLLNLEREYVCKCGQLPEWNGKKLVLQVDHIDGNSYNNLQNNLRFLCPNCHTQTSTFGRKIRPITSMEEG